MSVIARTLALVLALPLAIACSADKPDTPTEPDRASPAENAQEVVPADTRSEPKRKERPLPAFSGWTLDNERLEIASLIGKRLVIVFFNPEVDTAKGVLDGVSRVAQARGKHNFEVVGIATGSSRSTATEFVAAQGIAFRVIDDSSAAISRRFGVRSPIWIVGADAEGYMTWGLTQPPGKPKELAERIETQLRKYLRLSEAADEPGGLRPEAPPFSAQGLDGDKFELAQKRGEPVILMFFLHTCSHCHEVLRFMKEQLEALPEKSRPTFVGLEITGRAAAVRERLREEGLDFFPVIFDDDAGSISAAYGVFGGVPDTVGIDAQGRIAWRIQGWRPDHDGPLLRMRLARFAGTPVPMLLRTNGFSGSELCGVCHESQHDTWQLTSHASAFDTLVRHGADTNEECVGCHVVGFEQTGGFKISPRTAQLEDVGCESCHGRGGPHLSPEFVSAGNYAKACLTCHDPKHSLGFEYGTFLPRISHAANAQILELPAEERRRVLAERGALRKDLLPSNVQYVGSDACASCHPAETATWAAGPHAGALKTLAKSGKQGDANCLKCHTTGFGKNGGFPKAGEPASHSDLARVGCESCHGPGGGHVEEASAKLGSIVSLGDKCDSCVILQICGSCHDEANDPGFEFEVLDKIEKIRHGTIEAGTGKPLPPKNNSAATLSPHALFAHLIEASEHAK